MPITFTFGVIDEKRGFLANWRNFARAVARLNFGQFQKNFGFRLVTPNVTYKKKLGHI